MSLRWPLCFVPQKRNNEVNKSFFWEPSKKLVAIDNVIAVIT